MKSLPHQLALRYLTTHKHTHTHIQSVPDALREIAQRLEFSVVLNLGDFFSEIFSK